MMPQEIQSYLPLAAVLIPLLSFIMIMFAQNLVWWRNSWSLIGSAGTLVAVVMMYQYISTGQELIFKIPMIVTPYNFFFRVDEFGFLFALIIAFIWLAATIFALEYMNHEENRGRFFAFFMLTFSGLPLPWCFRWNVPAYGNGFILLQRGNAGNCTAGTLTGWP